MNNYVIVSDGRVIAGPRPWAKYFFEAILRDDLEIEYTLPSTKSDRVPIEIANGVRVLAADIIEQNYNSKIEYLHGPFWNFDNDVATGTFEIQQNDLEAIKNALKARVAQNRWHKETRGIKVTVQNTEVTIDTNRGTRDIFVQKYMLMEEGTTVRWKFPECWLDLTKSDLGAIVAAGAQHVESQFQWESDTCSDIDACTTAQELDAVDLGDPYP